MELSVTYFAFWTQLVFHAQKRYGCPFTPKIRMFSYRPLVKCGLGGKFDFDEYIESILGGGITSTDVSVLRLSF